MINNVTLDFAGKLHTKEIAALEQQCFSVPWSQKALSDFLDYQHNKILCAFENNTIIGYISYSLVCNECSIENVAVAPNYRRYGVGSLILQGLLEHLLSCECSCIFLEVRQSNTPAINLYKKHGFTQCGIRKNFYTKPTENALLMSLNIR